MSKITVDLEAFYGYSCGFQGHGSNETIEVEISDDELAALKQIDEAEVSAEAVAQAIEDGDPTLEALHEKLSDAFYNMVEEYWLFEAYNECLHDCLRSSLKEDVSNGLYAAPIIDPDGFKHWKDEFEDDEDYEDFDDEDECFDDDDDKDSETIPFSYEDYEIDDYYEWVKKHDHWFIAERVGLDLDACHDDEVNYTIRFNK